MNRLFTRFLLLDPPSRRIQPGGETEVLVVLAESEGLVPVRSDDGVGVDVHVLGFGLLAHAGQGGSVFLFLEGACHFRGEERVVRMVVLRRVRLRGWFVSRL